MKKVITLFSFATLFITACTKPGITRPGSTSLSASVNDQLLADRTNAQLLTSKTWIYMRYFINYTDTVNYGTVGYNRGHANNIVPLDNNTVKFNANGTVDEHTNTGEYVPGTWQFTNDEQTAMVVSNSYGTFYSTILKLNNNKFIWNNANDKTTGVMEPKEE